MPSPKRLLLRDALEPRLRKSAPLETTEHSGCSTSHRRRVHRSVLALAVISCTTRSPVGLLRLAGAQFDRMD